MSRSERKLSPKQAAHAEARRVFERIPAADRTGALARSLADPYGGAAMDVTLRHYLPVLVEFAGWFAVELRRLLDEADK